MPAVPVVQAPSAAPEQLQAPRLDSVASPDVFNAGAKQDAQLAQGLGAAGAGVSAIFADMKKRDDQDTVLRAEVGLKDSYLEYHKQVSETRRGEKSKGVFEETRQWWDDQVKKQAESLGNDEQRRAFIQRAAATRLASLGEMSQFEANETGRAQKDARLGATDTGINLAARIPSQANLDSAQKLIDEEIAFLKERQGMDQKAAEAYRVKRTTQLHSTVFRNLLLDAGNYAAAKGYLEAANAKGEIAQDQYDNLKKALDSEGGMDVLAQQWRSRTLTAGLSEDDAIKAIRAPESGLTGKEQEHVAARVKQYYAEMASDRVGKLSLAIVEGKGVTEDALKANPEYLKLTDAERAKVLSAWKSDKLHREQQSYQGALRSELFEQRKARLEEDKKYRAGMPTAMALSDPTELMKLSRVQLAAKLDELGSRHMSALLNDWDRLNANREKIKDFKVSHDLFNEVGKDLGLPTDKKPSELSATDRERIFRTRAQVNELLQAEMIRRGNKPMSLTEQEEFIRRKAADTVMRGNWYSIGGVGADTVPAITVLPSEAARVRPPQAFIDAATVTRRQQNLPVNPEILGKLWLGLPGAERAKFGAAQERQAVTR